VLFWFDYLGVSPDDQSVLKLKHWFRFAKTRMGFYSPKRLTCREGARKP
jgi:hypothetical protein